ncbi:MAG: MFS transporter [candidate division Zixibacteria bacterium]|nr:MFS transporter [candidate division Zixibacteria bacterium]
MDASAMAKQKSAFDVIKGYFLDFKVLKDCKLEYWTVQVINLLDSLAYFAFLNIAVVFLSETMGFSDIKAGYIFTVFTISTTLLLFVSGFVTDSLGIKKAMYLAMALLLIARGGIVICGFFPNMPYRSTLMWPLFLLLAPGSAMVQTIFQAAVRRYTSNRARSAGFSMWYLVMNIGAALGGFAIDFVRLTLKLDNTWIVNIGVFTGVLCTILTVLFIRNELQVLAPGEKPEVEEEATEKKTPWQILCEVVSQSAFWRFLVLVSCVIGVRAVFLYMALLQPKYWLRVIGENAPMGLFQAINPVLIVVGLILFIPLANKFNIYKMLIFGGMISSISLFALVVPWRWFSNDIATAYTMMTVTQLVILSIGEIIWSPKLQEYTAAVAPPGQEGSYLGMSLLPYFIAKTFIGLLSGHMLLRFCPEGIQPQILTGTLPFWRSPEAMWLILGAFAIFGLVIAMVFKRWLTFGVKLDPVRDASVAH